MLKNSWTRYQEQIPYPQNVPYDRIMTSIDYLISIVEKELIVV